MRYSIFGYLIGEGFRNVFKNKKSTIASLIIMCATMFIFGIFFVLGENITHITETVEQQQGMEAFIYDEATEAQVTELGNKIRNMEYVNTVIPKTKEDALEQVKRMFKDKKATLATFEGDENPFKASFVITLTDLSKAEEVYNQIINSDIVASIQIRSDTIEALVTIANGVKIVSGVIIVILILISIFIIMNTIKLTVHARRKEISIMKYVGATNGFIRWPFMVEGMLIGLISAIISVLILGGCYTAVANQIEQALVSTQLNVVLLTFQDLLSILIIVYLVLGLGIGAIGSRNVYEEILRSIRYKNQEIDKEKRRKVCI
ncbi:MAG: ABC transporter permease [Clostridia bacterium]|nr:ABC transporter permease [Clostridia bacterium]